MSYDNEILLNSSKKNFLAIIEPAVQVTDWTLLSGNVYYYDFSISSNFIEYVSKVTIDGNQLDKVLTTPSSGEYFWDYENLRLYINVGSNPSTYFVSVFFELYLGSKTFYKNRIIEDSNSEIVYFEPRIIDATIPQIDQDDFLLYGSNSGSIELNNKDAAFYAYENASYRKKKIKIYHLVNNEIFQIYSGFIDRFDIDDNSLTLNYRQLDFIFNESFNSYLETGMDLTKGFLSSVDYPLLDPAREGYCIRHVYGVVDDIIPVNIDYSLDAQLTNNRDFIVRSLGNKTHILNNTILASPSSTGTRLYVGPHFYQKDDSVNINGEYTFISAIGSNYIDVSPAVTPPSTGNILNRSTIGYIKIKDSTGIVYNLAYGRDYTEATFANNTLGFILADNFEANHAGLTLFNPDGMSIFCRVYGKKHATVNDSILGNMTKANYIIYDLLENYAGIDTNDINTASFLTPSTNRLGFSIPDDLVTTFNTYREIINKINISTLGQMYQDSSNKFNYRLNGPMGSSESTFGDIDLLAFGISYDAENLFSHVRVSYAHKEAPNGSIISSSKRISKISDMARYLHEDFNEYTLETYLIDETEADTLARRYLYIFEDWARSYSMKVKTQLSNAITGKIITIERFRLDGYNYLKNVLRTKKMRITTIKKGLSDVSFSANPQNNIEKNSGVW